MKHKCQKGLCNSKILLCLWSFNINDIFQFNTSLFKIAKFNVKTLGKFYRLYPESKEELGKIETYLKDDKIVFYCKTSVKFKFKAYKNRTSTKKFQCLKCLSNDYPTGWQNANTLPN